MMCWPYFGVPPNFIIPLWNGDGMHGATIGAIALTHKQKNNPIVKTDQAGTADCGIDDVTGGVWKDVGGGLWKSEE